MSAEGSQTSRIGLVPRFLRESSVLHGLLHFKAFDLLDEDDLASLSPETRSTVEGFEALGGGEG